MNNSCATYYCTFEVTITRALQTEDSNDLQLVKGRTYQAVGGYKVYVSTTGVPLAYGSAVDGISFTV